MTVLNTIPKHIPVLVPVLHCRYVSLSKISPQCAARAAGPLSGESECKSTDSGPNSQGKTGKKTDFFSQGAFWKQRLAEKCTKRQDSRQKNGRERKNGKRAGETRKDTACEKARGKEKSLRRPLTGVDLTDEFRAKRISAPGETVVRFRRNATGFRAGRIGEIKQKFCRISIFHAKKALRCCHVPYVPQTTGNGHTKKM